jgi:hypothetical protein
MPSRAAFGSRGPEVKQSLRIPLREPALFPGRPVNPELAAPSNGRFSSEPDELVNRAEPAGVTDASRACLAWRRETAAGAGRLRTASG